ESDITIWAAGVAIPKAISEWGFPQDRRGRLAVDDYLQVKGFPGVYAAGDIAGQDDPLPQLAQPAIQTGQAAARASAAQVAAMPRSRRSPSWEGFRARSAGPPGSACTSPR